MSAFNIYVLIMRDNMIISGEIYTTGKNFTLPPTVTAVTKYHLWYPSREKGIN